MTAPTIADLGAIRQMAADLDHARRCGHRMGTPARQASEPGWRAIQWSVCDRCRGLLVVYIGEPVAHRWDGIDLPCRGGGA